MADQTKEDVEATIARWARRQTKYWTERRPNRASAEREYRRLNAEIDCFFVFEFAGGEVRLLEKLHYTAEEMLAPVDGKSWRAATYLRFFRQVVASVGAKWNGLLGMSMDDRAHGDERFPFAAFQKPMGRPAILLPDIDALDTGFYATIAADTLGYAEKANRAVFAGSTTGSEHSYDSVEERANARMRSGLFFRGMADVDFRLPRIVQCVEEEAEAAIRNLGFGGREVPWSEQLRNKFVISMDGNGASCRRVAMTLASNSVLLKYESPHMLYYFPGLKPGVHYLPIRRDAEVVKVVRTERKSAGMFADVAENGRRFFADFLTEAPMLAYTAQVLEMYFDAFSDEPSGPALDAAALPVSGVAHISMCGDVACDFRHGAGERGSGLAIEGFSLNAPDGVTLEYLGVSEEGETGWCAGGAFAGSRGKGKPLQGFAVRLTGDAALGYRCRYFARFVDGVDAGPMADGALCRSANGAALEQIALEIVFD